VLEVLGARDADDGAEAVYPDGVADIEGAVQGGDAHVEAVAAAQALDLALRVDDGVDANFEVQTIGAMGNVEAGLAGEVFDAQKKEHLILETDCAAIEYRRALHRHIARNEDGIGRMAEKRGGIKSCHAARTTNKIVFRKPCPIRPFNFKQTTAGAP